MLRAAERDNSEPVENVLLNQNELLRRKKEFMKAKELDEIPFTPAITKMARQLERDGPAHERLYEEGKAKILKGKNPKKSQKSKQEELAYGSRENKVYFCPEQEPVETSNNIYRPVSVSNYLHVEINKEKEKKMKEEKVNKMLERNKDWAIQREQKITRMRENRVDPDLSECTFAPKTRKSAKTSEVSRMSNFSRESTRTQNSQKVLVNGIEFEVA